MKAITNLNDPSLVRALAHPLRARILGALQERRASPRELSEEFGEPLGNVSYHVRTLANLKLIKLVKKTPRRGAIEHHYVAVAGARVTDEAWAGAPGVVKKAMVASALGEVARSVGDAAAVGGFDRQDAHLTRTRLVLDEKGWSQLAKVLGDVLERTERIQEESQKRLERADHQAEMSATLVMMLFEQMPSLIGSPTEAAGPMETTASDGQHKRARSDGGRRRAAKTG